MLCCAHTEVVTSLRHIHMRTCHHNARRNPWVDLRGGSMSALSPIASLPLSAPGVTFAAWLRWDSGAGTIFRWGELSASFSASGSVYAAAASGGAPVVRGEWIHVLVSFGATTNVYVNGNPYGAPSPSAGPPPAVPRNSFQVGAFWGGVSDVQIYFSTNVSAADLYGGYAASKPPAPPAPAPVPPAAPFTLLGASSQGGFPALGAVHLWLPGTTLVSLTGASSRLLDSGTSPSAPASVTTEFVGSAWKRRWGACRPPKPPCHAKLSTSECRCAMQVAYVRHVNGPVRGATAACYHGNAIAALWRRSRIDRHAILMGDSIGDTVG